MQNSKSNNKDHNKRFFERVYETVKKIPQGEVMTYGQVAEIIGTRDARKVGWALHGNSNLNIPCHRVVNKDGRIAVNYSFMGGWKEQKKRLIGEGVNFIDEMHVDLKKHLWGNKLNIS